MTKIKGADSLTYNQSTDILKQLPGNWIPVGSYLSHQPIQNDLDFIIMEPNNLINVRAFLEDKFPQRWLLTKGGRSVNSKRLDYFPIIKGKKIVMNFWVSSRENIPFFILAYGYPRGFTIAIKKKLKDMGYHLSQYGLFDSIGNRLDKTMGDVFDILGLEFRTPEEEYYKHHKKI